MRILTNTRVSDSRIKVRPKVYNTKINYLLPKYTELGLTFKGNIDVKGSNGSIAFGFSSDSYIETCINLAELNTYDTIIFKVKFKQISYDSHFVNTLGSKSFQVNGVYSNGQLSLKDAEHDLTGSTGTKISDYIGKWLYAETIIDRKSNTVTNIYRDEANSVIGFSKNEFDSIFESFQFPEENLLIGKGLNEYPAYNLEIDLLETYVIADGNNLCPWRDDGIFHNVQRYMHSQIGTKDRYTYRMFSGLILTLGTKFNQVELRPKNDPQLWQRDGNYVKTVFTTNPEDYRSGNLSTVSKGLNCVDEYELQRGEYVVKYTFNNSFDLCFENGNQNMFCPVGNTFGSNVGSTWNQMLDCTVDIFLLNCTRLYAFAFNNFGSKTDSSMYKYSPRTKEYYEIDDIVVMDKTVEREREHYKEILN